MVIEAIAEKGLLAEFEHPNRQKYPNQRVFVVEIDGYAYCVPYFMDGNLCVLKTIYPSRRFKHLIEGASDDQVRP